MPAATDIVVDITYCGELKHDAAIDGLRYTLPTSVAPRYGSYPGEVIHSNAVAKGGISITVDLNMASSAIRKIQSPSHPIAVSMGATSKEDTTASFAPSKASATLTLGSTELAADFVLQLLIDDISKPQAILETHPSLPNQRALMATLVPRFSLEPSTPEIVFIADQSGSMGGSKNTALVKALKIFLKSLPVGVRFNICAFGSRFNFLWPKSQAYNEANINVAIGFVDEFRASYGGTEILQPITAAFEQRLPDLPLEVMLLTDGEIWGEDAVFSYINEQIHDKKTDARVFTLGIGTDVSHTLVEGVARAGNGFAQFVTQNEDTDQKVIRMLKGALYPHTTDYELEVNYRDDGEAMSDDEDFEIVEKVNDCLSISDNTSASTAAESAKPRASFFDPDADMDKPIKTDNTDRYAHLPAIEAPKLLQAPCSLPPLFPFNRTTLYLLLGPDTAQKNVASVTLQATAPLGPLELVIPVSSAEGVGTTVHQLAARKAVQDLEEGRGWLQAAKVDGKAVRVKYESRFDEIVEREAVRLGEKFQVAGKWCSFVAVEEHGEDQQATKKELGNVLKEPELEVSHALKGEQKRMRQAVLNSHNLTNSGASRTPKGSAARCAFSHANAQQVELAGFSVQSASIAPRKARMAPRKQLASMAARRVPPSAAAAPPSGAFGAPASARSRYVGPILSIGRAVRPSRSVKASRRSAHIHTLGRRAPRELPQGATAHDASRRSPSVDRGTSSMSCGISRGPASKPGASRMVSHGPPFSMRAIPSTFRESLLRLGAGNDSRRSISRDRAPQNTARGVRLAPSQRHMQGPSHQPASLVASRGLGAGSSAAPRVPDRTRSGHLPLPRGPCSREPHPNPAISLTIRSRSSAQPHAGGALYSASSFGIQGQQSYGASPAYGIADCASASADDCDEEVDYSDEDMGFGLFDGPPSRKASAPPQPLGIQEPLEGIEDHLPGIEALEGRELDQAGEIYDDEGAFASALKPKKKKSVAPKPNSIIHELIGLQSFSGAWSWSEKLFDLIGVDYNVNVDKAHSKAAPATRATALAVAFFETKLKNKKEVWEMVVAKARAWLAKQLEADQKGVDAYVAKAAAYL